MGLEFLQEKTCSFRSPPHYLAQEEMYSYVTVAEDQNTKGKGTVVVQDA
jgi:hypothetical protein